MTTLSWDLGTAYDFFVSLQVLHQPADFGLRPSWAAGVRSRIPAGPREFLERTFAFFPAPLRWIHSLPLQPKDSNAALAVLAALPAGDRLAALTLTSDTPSPIAETVLSIAQRGTWNDTDLEVLRSTYQKRGYALHANTLPALCQAWSDPTAFGEAFLPALQAYRECFFAEEELRIAPVLESSLARAQALAETMPLTELLTELSNGVQFSELETLKTLYLAPSYWSTPLIFIRNFGEGQKFILFAGRPANQALVPGENVPADVINALKALADPTRLRILRYLADQPLTPTDLSQRLRLRPPTVIHHLSALRLAGLVQITIQAEGERRYALRSEAVETALRHTRSFLKLPPS